MKERLQRLEAGQQRRRKVRARKDALKLALGCQKCGYAGCAAALSFHHRDPATKTCNVGREYVWTRIEAEIAKCDLLCANCHMELTFLAEPAALRPA